MGVFSVFRFLMCCRQSLLSPRDYSRSKITTMSKPNKCSASDDLHAARAFKNTSDSPIDDLNDSQIRRMESKRNGISEV